jgi:NAD+ diphosphatase
MRKYWFIFNEGKILLKKQGGVYMLPFGVLPPVKAPKSAYIILDKKAVALPVKSAETPAGFEFVDLRASYDLLGAETFWAAGRAAQMAVWDKNSRFCPCCGIKTKPFSRNARICPECKKEIYPAVAPALMVLVRKGGAVLMARGINYRGRHYGLIAGFLEPGETLEECAKREVKEETNLEIKNLKYFMSQPWPFPSGIMIGFTADYAGGRLKIDKTELSDAKFFTADKMPPLPGKISLARKMVNAWLKERKKIQQ